MMPLPIRIIVIDDDESIREAAKNLLGPAGFEVRSFARAEDLMDARGLEDVLILQLGLPGMAKLRTAIYDTIPRGCSHQHHRR